MSMEGNRFLILTILAVFLTTEIHCECPEGWFPHDSSCYLFYQQGKNWTAAEDYCRSFHSYLTNINDESENLFLKKQLNLHGNTADFWVGATDAISEGGWRWMPGFDPIVYSDWMPGQPNDDHDQDCMQLYHKYHYHWDDDHCNEAKAFICEMRSTYAANYSQ